MKFEPKLGILDMQKLLALCIKIARNTLEKEEGATKQKISQTAISQLAEFMMEYYIDRGIGPENIIEMAKTYDERNIKK